MMQEFKLVKNLVLRNYSKFLFNKQKRFCLDLEPSTILTNQERKFKNQQQLENLKAKFKHVIDEDLTESNKYLLAAIFKSRPGHKKQDKEGGLTEAVPETDSPTKMRKKVKKEVSNMEDLSSS